ncbi:MAG: hypothetical protein FWH23_02175 [Bacteroidales bacterium]|nr:hypothetical protein [Bacteroidales bacterium]
MNRKRIIIILSISILACLGGAFWLLRKPQSSKQTTSITTIASIPYDAIFIAKFKELSFIDKAIADSAAVWKTFLTKPAPLAAWLHNLCSLSNDETLAEILRSEASISAHPSGKNEIALLCCIALPPSVDVGSWEELLKRHLQTSDITAYYNTKIYALPFGKESLYIAYIKGVALICTSNTVLQSAIRQGDSGESLERHNAHFASVIKALGDNNAGICISHKELNRLLVNIENEPPLAKANQFLRQCSDWTVLDGNISPQLIQINGFTFPSFTNNKFLSVLLNQGSNNVEVWDALPVNTTFLLSFTLSNPETFLTDYADYLEKHKELDSYRSRRNTLDNSINSKSADLFIALSPAEIALAYLTYGIETYQVSIIKSNNPKYALEQLQEILPKEQKQIFVESQEKFENRNISIYRNPAKGLLGTTIDTVLFNGNDSYFTLIDNFFYFSDDSNVLKNLAKTSFKNSLKKQLLQTNAKTYFNNNSNIMLLLRSPQQAGKALLGFFNKHIQESFRELSMQYESNVHALQLYPENDKFFVNFFTFFSTEPLAIEPVDTTKNAVSPATTGGTVGSNKVTELLRVEVINHYTKQKEWFIQYSNNNIALRSKAEKLLWQKQFSSPITGPVIQIDFLNNKKLQCLFVAGGKLYLYDRNGSVVKPFPVTLQSTVTLESGSTITVQKQPRALKISKDGKTTIIYLNNGKVELK